MGVWGDKIMDSDESGDCAALLYQFAGLDPDDDDFDAAAPAVREALSERYDQLLKHIETRFKPDGRITRDRAHLVLLVLLIRADCAPPQALLQKIAAESSVFS